VKQKEKQGKPAQVPVCRPVARRVLELLDARGPHDPEIRDLVGADPGLALRMIEAANRAMSGVGVTVSSVDVALQILGRGACRTVVREGLAAPPPGSASRHLGFVRHSVVTSFVAGSLAQVLESADPEEARIAGLLHGVDSLLDRPGYLASRRIPARLCRAVGSGKSEPARREDEEVLAWIIGLAHRMAVGFGAVAACDCEASESPEADDRLRGLEEVIHERVARDLADGLLVLGVLIGVPRLDLASFEEALTHLVAMEPGLATPPEGLTVVVHDALTRMRDAGSEVGVIDALMAAVRGTPGVARALLVLEEAGEAMISASQEQQPFFVRTRDLTAVAEGMSELMLIAQRGKRASVMSRGAGFDGVFNALDSTEILVVPLRAGRQHVGAVVIPTNRPLSAVLAPTLDVLAQAVGEAMERVQLTHRSFLLTERITKDALTGVLQRSHLMDLLEAEIHVANRYTRPIAMVMLDIDNFKDWNDTYGHQVGDVLLRDVARAIQDCSREGDLVGRYGGDEFIIVLPGQSMEQAQAFAERVRERVERLGETMTEVLYQLKLSVSLGVAAAATRSVEPGALLFRADHALYRAKERGRNRVHVEQT
jgi:diguanylate cyclase (GGDEF)-like protein